MPTFFARRYLRKVEEVGNTEKVLGVVILLLVAGIITAFVVQVVTDRHYLFDVDEQGYSARDQTERPRNATPLLPSHGPLGAESPFPDPDLEGWRAPARVDRFGADELYVKIDGRDEAYLRFGVVGLTFGTYRHERDVDRTVDVYWYDMGQPANALSMYESEQPPDVASVPVGRVGYQVGGAVFFCKGSSYVQLIPAHPDEADANVVLRIAERLADQID
jgi:hypothetical protein